MKFNKIGVIGTGQMGAGICQVAATFDKTVLMADMNKEIAEKAKTGIAKRLARLVEKDKLDQAKVGPILNRLQPVDGLDKLNDVDLVIEAASEKVKLKLDIFKKLDEVIEANIILASNTSSISITLLAAATKRPDKVVGMHFMNPVPLMKLVEMIKGLQTSDETFNTVKNLAQELGKTVTISNDYPGFIVNRLLIPFLNEACFALMEGVASKEDIDTSINLGLNHPMGPFTLADLIGLDTVLAISEVLYEGFRDPKFRPNPLLVKHVEAGWLGRKSGRGFYIYE